MKVIDKRAERNDDWHVGDVLADNDDRVGLIVKNDNGKYCLMDIDPGNEGNYSTMEGYYGDSCENLAELYVKMGHNWHKVNAKLVIE